MLEISKMLRGSMISWQPLRKRTWRWCQLHLTIGVNIAIINMLGMIIIKSQSVAAVAPGTQLWVYNLHPFGPMPRWRLQVVIGVWGSHMVENLQLPIQIQLVKIMIQPTRLRKISPMWHVKKMLAMHVRLIWAFCTALRLVDIVLPSSMRRWRAMESHKSHCCHRFYSKPDWQRLSVMALQPTYKPWTTIRCLPSYLHLMERRKAICWNALIVNNNKVLNMQFILIALSTLPAVAVLMERWGLVPSKLSMEKPCMPRCSLRAANFWPEWRR